MAVRGNDANEALALQLAAGANVLDAARAAGMSERTARRRWATPEFKKKVAALRAEALRQAAARLADSMRYAAAVLVRLLCSDSEQIRLTASRVIIDAGSKLHGELELSERVADLEAAIAAQQRQRGRDGQPVAPVQGAEEGDESASDLPEGGGS